MAPHSNTSVRLPFWEARLIVEVFYVDVDAFGRAMSILEQMLSADEQHRMGEFAAEERRGEFVVVRGMLRLLLGKRSGVSARKIQFEYGPTGKPALLGGDGCSPLWFNVAHTRGLGVIALCRGGPVGVDVERVDAMGEFGPDAAALFEGSGAPLGEAGMEAQGIAQTEPSIRRWVQFEAVQKWRGEGVFARGKGEHACCMQNFALERQGQDFVGCVVAAPGARFAEGTWLTLADLSV